MIHRGGCGCSIINLRKLEIEEVTREMRTLLIVAVVIIVIVLAYMFLVRGRRP